MTVIPRPVYVTPRARNLVTRPVHVITGLDPVICRGTPLEQMAGSVPGHDVARTARKD